MSECVSGYARSGLVTVPGHGATTPHPVSFRLIARGQPCRRIPSPATQRLVEAGERVVDVPAKLAALVRLFDSN
jgi:hypothetical protein